MIQVPTRSTFGRAAVVAMLALMLVASSSAFTTPVEAQPKDRAPERIDKIEPLRIACAVDSQAGERGVLCRWSESTGDQVRAYQLLRIVNGSPREVVATITPDARLHAFDADIEPGDRIVYGVVARNRSGRVVAVGGPVPVGIAG